MADLRATSLTRAVLGWGLPCLLVRIAGKGSPSNYCLWFDCDAPPPTTTSQLSEINVISIWIALKPSLLSWIVYYNIVKATFLSLTWCLNKRIERIIQYGQWLFDRQALRRGSLANFGYLIETCRSQSTYQIWVISRTISGSFGLPFACKAFPQWVPWQGFPARPLRWLFEDVGPCAKSLQADQLCLVMILKLKLSLKHTVLYSMVTLRNCSL